MDRGGKMFRKDRIHVGSAIILIALISVAGITTASAGGGEVRTDAGGGEVRTGPPNQNLVRAVQQALAEQGYKPGAADGLMGSKTSGALSAFQRDHNLTPTGKLDPETMSALKPNSRP